MNDHAHNDEFFTDEHGALGEGAEWAPDAAPDDVVDTDAAADDDLAADDVIDETSIDGDTTFDHEDSAHDEELADDLFVGGADLPAEGEPEPESEPEPEPEPGEATAVAPVVASPKLPSVSSDTVKKVGIGVAALAVLAGVFGGAWAWTQGQQTENRAQAIRASVTDYFSAVTSGDVDKALSYSTTPVEKGPLLTPEVAKAAQQAAPISDVKVTKVDAQGSAGTAVATLTYKIGDREVTAEVPMSNTPSGWKIDEAVSNLTVAARGTSVNGVAIQQKVVQVLPGSYSAKASNPMLQFTGDPNTVVEKPGADVELALTPQLSAAGTQAVTDAAKKQFDACVASKVGNPPGCPWVLEPGGAKVDANSVRYTLKNDPWKSFAPKLDPQTMLAVGTIHYEIDASATATLGGRTGKVTLPLKYDTPVVVDLSKQPPAVRWAK